METLFVILYLSWEEEDGFNVEDFMDWMSLCLDDTHPSQGVGVSENSHYKFRLQTFSLAEKKFVVLLKLGVGIKEEVRFKFIWFVISIPT